jgi:hypothetical protein
VNSFHFSEFSADVIRTAIQKHFLMLLLLTCLPHLQALFFTYTGLSTPDGFKWMGVMTIAVTALYMLMYFPMWGGMFTKAKDGVSEEDYYLAEWTPEEKAQVRPGGLMLLTVAPTRQQ